MKKKALKTTALATAAHGIGKYSDQHAGIVAMNKERAQCERMAKSAEEFIEKRGLEIDNLKARQ